MASMSTCHQHTICERSSFADRGDRFHSDDLCGDGVGRCVPEMNETGRRNVPLSGVTGGLSVRPLVMQPMPLCDSDNKDFWLLG